MKHYKEQTEKLAIKELKAPEFLYIPMSQHIGAPAKPLVAVGDKVKVGQLIGSADAFVTADVHSSVSGEVVEILKMSNPQGSLVDVVKVKNDFQDTIDEKIAPKKDLEQLNYEEIREIARECGLVGMGGATFPTHVKLSPPEEKKVDAVILNAAECEPFLTADHRLLLEKTADVLYGLRAIAKACRAEKIFIGIEDNKMDAVQALKDAGAEKFCKIKVLKTAYPTGAEKVLVKKVLKRVVPNKGIPLDVGVVCCNVSTAYQLARTINTGLPLIDRVVTISGAFANPGNYLVRLGTLLSDVVQVADGYFGSADSGAEEFNQAAADYDREYKIVVGGPMMGFAIGNFEMPVIKGTSGVLLLNSRKYTAENCIRCAKCVDVCPLGLRPYQDQGADECMECGRCAYECPAHRFLVQNVKIVKQKLKAGV